MSAPDDDDTKNGSGPPPDADGRPQPLPRSRALSPHRTGEAQAPPDTVRIAADRAQGPRLTSFSVSARPGVRFEDGPRPGAGGARRRTIEDELPPHQNLPPGYGAYGTDWYRPPPPPPPREPSRLGTGFLFGFGFAAGSALFRALLLIAVYGAVILLVLSFLGE